MRYSDGMNTLAHLPQIDETVAIIAANVRAEIARAGLKDGEFAVRLNFTPMSMSRRLSGQTPFTTSDVVKIARYFGVSVGDLFTEHRAPMKPEPTDPTVESQRFAPITSIHQARSLQAHTDTTRKAS